MIYYFSGTGNSKAVANELGNGLNSPVKHIMEGFSLNDFPGDNQIGLVFPVYSWGVPPVMLDFIKNIPSEALTDIRRKNLWIVMTCGDEVAKAPEMVISELSKIGLSPQSIWSVIMPNDYVLLPGFDVDTSTVENEKLKNAPERIAEIIKGITSGQKGIDVTRGKMAWMKTKLVYPLFKRWGIFPKKWHFTNACVGCGICERNCPMGNIHLNSESEPQWGENCCSCLACYHCCPRHAVAYGKETMKKGQYFFHGFSNANKK